MKHPNPDHQYSYTPGDATMPKLTHTNLSAATCYLLQHASWAGVLGWDAFRERLAVVDPPCRLEAQTTGALSDNDVATIVQWFASQLSAAVSDKTARAAFTSAAHVNSYHPVRDYFAGLPAASLDLSTVARSIFGAETADIECTILRRWLIAAVRRVRNPGCKVDEMLVLAGPQGAGKSRFVQTLFGEFASEDLPPLKHKDAQEYLRGAWGIEVAELDKLLREDSSTVKSFISRTTDRYRSSYGRDNGEHPRTTILVGTTNQDDFLRDVTGDRRFRVIQVRQRIDLAYLAANRDAIWSAALAEANAGVQHYLTDEEHQAATAAASHFRDEDPWHSTIAAYMERSTGNRVTTADIYPVLGFHDIKDVTKRERNRVTTTLRQLGYIDKNNGGRFWVKTTNALAATMNEAAE